MKITAIAAALLVALSGCPSPRGGGSRVPVAVKIAEDAPGPGLTAYALPDSDETVYLPEEEVLTNAHFERMVAAEDAQRVWIDFVLTEEGGELLSAATEQNIGKRTAIVWGDEIVSAPVIREKLGRRGQITGDFTLEEAQGIASAITPIRFKVDKDDVKTVNLLSTEDPKFLLKGD